MNRLELIRQIKRKNSFLCIGLESKINKIPAHFLDYNEPILEFNKQIIDATKDLCVAYKPNIAFYESLGTKGWQILEDTLNYIPKDIFTIADAKRGDIGNTSKMYAKAFFQHMNFDAVTVAPYMGIDSVSPFLEFENKWVILLALTSNKGSFDFQKIESKDGIPLFQSVLKRSKEWGSIDNLMYVVGATRADDLKQVRDIIPDHFLLVPGVGAQGGDLQAVIDNGANDDVSLLINSSRGILYAGNDQNFAEASKESALKIQRSM